MRIVLFTELGIDNVFTVEASLAGKVRYTEAMLMLL